VSGAFRSLTTDAMTSITTQTVEAARPSRVSPRSSPMPPTGLPSSSAAPQRRCRRRSCGSFGRSWHAPKPLQGSRSAWPGSPAQSARQPCRVGDAFRAGYRGAGRRSGRRSGFHPAMVLAHHRACSLSVIAGNSRRNSIAAANSPSRSNAARIAAASSSDTTNIGQAWKPELSGASDGAGWRQ